MSSIPIRTRATGDFISRSVRFRRSARTSAGASAWILALVCCLGSVEICVAQIKHSVHFNVTNELLSNHVTSIAEASDGHIWIATKGWGIARFDGVEFQHFNNEDNLGTKDFSKVVAEGDHMWFGGNDLILKYTKEGFTPFTIQNFGVVKGIIGTKDMIFAVGEKRSVFLSREGVELHNIKVPPARFHNAVSRNDTLFVTSDSGLYIYTDEEWRKLPSEIQVGSCSTIDVDRNSKILFLDRNAGIQRLFDSQTLESVISAKDLPSSRITFIEDGSLGELFVGTEDKGLMIFNEIDSLWLSLSDQVQFDFVSDLLFDRWENTWVATAGGGLVRFSSQTYLLQSWPDLSGRFIKSLDKDGDKIYISYSNGQWDRISGNKLTEYNFPILGNQKVTHYLFDDTLRVPYATERGIYYPVDSFYFFLEKNDLGVSSVNDLFLADSSRLIGASPEGIFEINMTSGDSTEQFKFSTDLLFHTPVTKFILGNRQYQIWFYGNQCIGILDEAIIDNLAFNPTGMFLLENRMLISTEESGLYYADHVDSTIEISPVPGKEFARVISISRGIGDDIWLCDHERIYQCSLGDQMQIKVDMVFDKSTGLPPLEIIPDAMEISEDGRAFIGTSAGLLQLVPEAPLPMQSGPQLTLVSMDIGDRRLNHLSDSVYEYLENVGPGVSDLSIEVKAVDQRFSRDITYRYQLGNGADRWLTSRSDGLFNFISLSPGDYRFRVKAINSIGHESNILEIPFKVLQPFYNKWWFYLTGFLFLSFIIYGIYLARLRNRLRQAERKHRELETSKRLLQLEQSARRLQMNPHFIFNALQSIQKEVTSGSAEKARSDLQNFSQLMRNYLDHSRQERIVLEDEINILRQYLEVEKTLKDNRFSYSIHWAESIDPSFVEIPAMLIQPFVENAIKHGMPVRGQGVIEIDFQWQGSYLACVIVDNGGGFPNAIDTTTNHRSLGIRITQERLENYFQGTVASPLLLENISTENGNVKGARVRILLPVS